MASPVKIMEFNSVQKNGIAFRKPSSSIINKIQNRLEKGITRPYSEHYKYSPFITANSNGRKIKILKNDVVDVIDKNCLDVMIRLIEAVEVSYQTKKSGDVERLTLYSYACMSDTKVAEIFNETDANCEYKNADEAYDKRSYFFTIYVKAYIAYLNEMFDLGIRPMSKKEQKEHGFSIDVGTHFTFDKKKWNAFTKNNAYKSYKKYVRTRNDLNNNVYKPVSEYSKEVCNEIGIKSFEVRLQHGKVQAKHRHNCIPYTETLQEFNERISKKQQEEDEVIDIRKQKRIRAQIASLNEKDFERINAISSTAFINSIYNSLRLTSNIGTMMSFERDEYLKNKYGTYHKYDVNAAYARTNVLFGTGIIDKSDEDFYIKRVAKEMYEYNTGKEMPKFIERMIRTNEDGVRDNLKLYTMFCANGKNYNYRVVKWRGFENIYQKNEKSNYENSYEAKIKRKRMVKLYKVLGLEFNHNNIYIFEYRLQKHISEKLLDNKELNWFYCVLENKINLYIAHKTNGLVEFNYDAYFSGVFTADELKDLYYEAQQAIYDETIKYNCPKTYKEAMFKTEHTPYIMPIITADDDYTTLNRFANKNTVVVMKFKNVSVAMNLDDGTYYVGPYNPTEMIFNLSQSYNIDNVITSSRIDTNAEVHKPLNNFLYAIQCKNIAKAYYNNNFNVDDYDNIYEL